MESYGIIPPAQLQELKVLCQRPGLLVVNKASGHATESILSRVAVRIAPQSRLSLVSRLDAPTSGVLPLAHGEASGRYLQAQFAGRLVRKDYICLCEGPSLGETTLGGSDFLGSYAAIDQPLRTTGIDGVNSRTEVSVLGREATTAYVVKRRYQLSALSADPAAKLKMTEVGSQGMAQTIFVEPRETESK
eukprot:s816_g9.t1